MTSCSRRRDAPSIEDPSIPTPSSRADSSSETGIEMLFSRPSTSTNQRRMNFTPRSSTVRSTKSSLAVTVHGTVGPARGPVFIPQSNVVRQSGGLFTLRSSGGNTTDARAQAQGDDAESDAGHEGDGGRDGQAEVRD